MLLIGATAVSSAQTTIYSNNFESNNGDWTDGGNKCDYVDNDNNSPQGNASWRLRDDSGDDSSFYQNFDLSGYDEITITFSFKSNGFDDDDDRFEVLIDNNRIEQYRYDRDGWDDNGVRYTRSISVNRFDYDLNTTNQIKFETTKDTSDDDYLYIDEIEIIGTDYDYLFYENFSHDTSSGDANDFSGTDDSGNNIAWTANEQGAADRWDITSGMWRGKEVYTESSLTTSQINISGYEDLKFSFYIDYDDVDDNNDWIKVFYTIDNNSEVLLASYIDEDDNQTYIVNLPSSAIGSNIVLRIEMHQDDNNNEHRIDNIKLTGVYNPCEAPTANFTVSEPTIQEGQSIDFTNTSTNANSYSWNFGDGSATTTQTSPTHTFATAGTYLVTLTAVSDDCGSVTTTETITVTAAPLVLVQGIIQDWDANTDWTYTVTGDGTINSLGSNTTNTWGNQGGGTSSESGQITFNSVNINAESENLSFSFDYYLDDDVEGPGQSGQDYFYYSIYYNNNTVADVSEELITENRTQNTWITKSLDIPAGTTTFKVVFNYSVNYASNDFLAIDNVKLSDGNYWTGSENDLFTDTDNWSLGTVPGEDDTLIIPATKHLTIVHDTKFKNVIVKANGILTIAKTGSVTTTANFTNKTGGLVNMLSDDNEFSSLIVNGTATGQVVYNRWANNVEFGSNGNDVISSPVAGETWGDMMINNNESIINGSPYLNAGAYAFRPYNNGYSGWATYYTTNDAAVNIESGIGYRVSTPPNDSRTINFTGTIITSNVDVTIRRVQTRWNVVGNPYSSYISLEDFLIENGDVLDEDYVVVMGYNGVNNTDGWEYYNLASAAANNITIAPGQGFYLAAKMDNSTITFKPSMRTFDGEDDFLQDGMRAQEDVVNTFKINLASNNQTRSSEFFFLNRDAVTANFDLGYDSYVYNGSDNFNVYSSLENNTTDKLAIQSLPQDNALESIIPLGVHAQAGQQIIFSIANADMPENTQIYLEDRTTNTWTLLTDDTYAVTPNSNLSGTGRFYIHMQQESLSNTEFQVADVNAISIKSVLSTKQVVITGNLTSDTQVSIYDLNGKQVLNTTIKAFNTTNRVDAASFRTGVYIVTLKNKTQAISKQVVIK